MTKKRLYKISQNNKKKLRLCQDSNLVALNSEKLAQSAVNVMVIWTFLLLDRVDPMERFKFKK